MTVAQALTEYRALLWKAHIGSGGTFQPETCPSCKQVAEVDALIVEATRPEALPNERDCSRGGKHAIDQCHKCGAIFSTPSPQREPKA